MLSHKQHFLKSATTMSDAQLQLFHKYIWQTDCRTLGTKTIFNVYKARMWRFPCDNYNKTWSRWRNVRYSRLMYKLWANKSLPAPTGRRGNQPRHTHLVLPSTAIQPFQPVSQIKKEGPCILPDGFKGHSSQRQRKRRRWAQPLPRHKCAQSVSRHTHTKTHTRRANAQGRGKMTALGVHAEITSCETSEPCAISSLLPL